MELSLLVKAKSTQHVEWKRHFPGERNFDPDARRGVPFGLEPRHHLGVVGVLISGKPREVALKTFLAHESGNPRESRLARFRGQGRAVLTKVFDELLITAIESLGDVRGGVTAHAFD